MDAVAVTVAMMRPSGLARPATFGVIVLLAALVLAGTAIMPVAAQETRSGDEVVIGEDETVSGDLATAAGSVVVEGGITQVEPVEPQIPGTAATIAGIVYSLLVNVVLGAVLLFALPEFSRTTTVRAISETARSAGVGLVVLFAAPVALALLFVTIVGIPIALGGIVLYGLLIWIGYVYGAITVGSWLLMRADANTGRWAALLLGLVVVAIVSVIPIVGWLVGFAVAVIGMGAVSLGLVRGFRERRNRDERRERLNDQSSQWPEDDERRYRSLQDERQTRAQRPSSEDFDPGPPSETSDRSPSETDDRPPGERDDRPPDDEDDRPPQ